MKLALHPTDVRFKSIETNESAGNCPCVQVAYGHLKGEYYDDPYNAVWSFLMDVDVPVNAQLCLKDLSE
jgi:hypothetical protein